MHLPSFDAMFSKGDSFRDFLFVYMGAKSSQTGGLLLKERICSDRSKFFSFTGANSLRANYFLLSEKILFFMRLFQFIWEATMKMTELLSLNVFTFTLRS